MKELQPGQAAHSAGSILRDWLSAKMQSNPAFSLRAMARYLGVSAGFLSQVMSGRKKLSSARAAQFSQILKLSSRETNRLMRATTLDAAKPAARSLLEKHVLSQRIIPSYKDVELEKFKILSEWFHIALLDLSETREFRPDPSWIARRLKVSPVQAASALQRLQDLGLLVEIDGRLKKSDQRLAFGAKHSHVAIREYHKQMIAKSLESLNDGDAAAFERRSITGITLSVDPRKLPEAFERIDHFRREMEEFLSSDESAEVYQLNIQLFNLSHPIQKRGPK